MLSVKNLFFSHGKNQILNNINFTANEGEIICFVGPSGCGKTTLLRVIAGLLPAGHGKVTYNKHDISDHSPYHRNIGFVAQNPSLLPHLTLRENIALGFKTKMRPEYNVAIDEHLKMVDMLDFGHLYPDNISVGQQQKISIIRAMIARPNIMLFDEPYANLDVINKDNLIEQSLSLMKGSKAVKLMVTHNPEEAMQIADQIFVLYEGKILQKGTADELSNKPANEFVARLFGLTNSFSCMADGKNIITPLGNVSVKDKPKKSNVTVIIRPSEIYISKQKKAGYVKAKITATKFMSYGILYKCKLDNSDAIVKVLSPEKLQENTSIYLKANKFHIL